jgi:hypothetical protein
LYVPGVVAEKLPVGSIEPPVASQVREDEYTAPSSVWLSPRNLICWLVSTVTAPGTTRKAVGVKGKEEELASGPVVSPMQAMESTSALSIAKFREIASLRASLCLNVMMSDL